MNVPPVAENDSQIRQDSFNSLSTVEIGFCDVKDLQAIKPKPRRRLQETDTDYADGLDVLIQKTKAIGLRAGEEGLLPGEDGNEWLDALNHKGEKLLWGVTKIRKYVCGDGSDTHAEELIKFQVLERLLYFLDNWTEEDTLFEILWVVTNIAAGPTAHTTALVEKNYLPALGKLLRHRSGSIRTQAAWAIGNIIGDREGYRDLVLEAGLLPAILDIWNGSNMDPSARKESFRISLWIVDNMCRYKPDWHLMKPAFDIIPLVLQESEPSVLKECCWAVARILHQSGRHIAIDNMITPVFCNRLLEILSWRNSQTTHPILRALINLASSKNPMHLKYIVNAGLLGQLQEFLVETDSRHSFEIFAVQIIGNLCSQEEYALRVVEHAHIYQWLITYLNAAESVELRNEICISLRNMLFHQNATIAAALAQVDVVGALKTYLHRTKQGNNQQLICLEAIWHLGHTSPPAERLLSIRSAAPIPSDDPRFDYKQSMRDCGLFNIILPIYVASSGQSLDEMDQEEYEGTPLDAGSDSDEETTPIYDVNSAPPRSVSFDISNPHSYSFQALYQNSSSTLKVKTATIAFRILQGFFPAEFNQAIHSSQQESQVCRQMNDMAYIGGNSHSKIADLADVFQRMSPTK